MNILYTLDNNFFPQLLVSLDSLIKNTTCKLNVYVICDEISNENTSKLSILNNNRINIQIKEAPQISEKLIPDRKSSSQFYRLYLTDIFTPMEKIDRLIYLDCDTLITSEEFETLAVINLQGNVIGATIDPWSKKYKRMFNMPITNNMFNSGVIVVDLKLWRIKKITERLSSLIEHRKHFIQGDQGLLNELFKGSFFTLDPKFNVITSYYEFSYAELMNFRRPTSYYSEKDIRNALQYPSVIHFISTFSHNRPWFEESKHPYNNQWRLTYKKFFGKSPHLKKIDGFRYFDFIPRKLAIYILGILQCEVRPILLSFKRK